MTGVQTCALPILLNRLTHFIAAFTVSVYGGLVLNNVSILGLNFTFPYPLNYLITIIFLIAFINMVNLIDGLDGLAGGICSIYFATIAIIGLVFTQMEGLDVILALIMFGATAGFLVYNFPPAKTYMGNCGSDFLGFIVGVDRKSTRLNSSHPSSSRMPSSA